MKPLAHGRIILGDAARLIHIITLEHDQADGGLPVVGEDRTREEA